MVKPSKLNFDVKATGDQYTASEANLVHSTIDAAIDDYVGAAEHTKAVHDALDIDAATIEGQTVDLLGSQSVYGETKLWNKLLNDIPDGWCECDGTNGTEDLSAVNPSANTVYIMYVGGENVTARTINVTNSIGSDSSFTLKGLSDETVTSIEDGTPFKLSITAPSASSIDLLVTCNRTSDDTLIMSIDCGTISMGNTESLTLVQYLDCTWELIDAS